MINKKTYKHFQNNKGVCGVPVAAQQVMNPTSIYEDMGSTPGLAQWVEDLAWLWLAAAAPN